MIENGIGISGGHLEKMNTHSIYITNKVNGKQVRCYVNASGITVPSGAGQVISMKPSMETYGGLILSLAV